jgi:hypothetical protein
MKIIQALKKYLKENKEKFVKYEDIETSFGYIIETEHLDMNALMKEIDDFCETFDNKKESIEDET